MRQTRNTSRKPPRGTRTSSALGKFVRLFLSEGNIKDDSGMVYTREHALELVSLGMAEANSADIQDVLGICTRRVE